MAQRSVASDSILGEVSSSTKRSLRKLTPSRRQLLERWCSDANRISPCVASNRGRANRGLQESSLFSKRIRRLSLGLRGLVVFVVVDEALEDVVIIKGEVVVVSHIIVAKIERVAGREEPVRKLSKICASGLRIVHEAAQIIARS